MGNTYLTTGLIQLPNGGLATPKFAFAAVAASATDTAIVAAVSGKKIRVLSMMVGASGTATSFFFTTKPAGAGTQICGNFLAPLSDAITSGFCQVGLFETNAGEGLSMSTGAGSNVAVQVTYIEI